MFAYVYDTYVICMYYVCMYICAYVYVAHTAFWVFIRYGSKLCMRVVKTFGYRRQTADNCLRIFVHKNTQTIVLKRNENVLLMWVYDTHA